MITLLSPAKNLRFEGPYPAVAATKPQFAKDAAALVGVARDLSTAAIKRLMGVSTKLAELNRDRFRDFVTSGRAEITRPAIFAFNGDVYQGLDATTLDDAELRFAQETTRILSGLYGLLRPFDAIQPYRLEMGVRLKTPRGATLYDYWGDAIAKEINKAVASHQDQTVVNLASEEYFSAVDRDVLQAPAVSVVFREEKDGALRTLQFFSKRARGMMARWMIRHRIEKADDLRAFPDGGYRYAAALSAPDRLVFTRPQPPAKGKA